MSAERERRLHIMRGGGGSGAGKNRLRLDGAFPHQGEGSDVAVEQVVIVRCVLVSDHGEKFPICFCRILLSPNGVEVPDIAFGVSYTILG